MKDFQIALKAQATSFFQCSFLSLLVLPIMNIYFTENNIVFTKIQNFV